MTNQELAVLANMLDHIAAAHFANDIHRAEYLACEAAARVVRAVAQEQLAAERLAKNPELLAAVEMAR